MWFWKTRSIANDALLEDLILEDAQVLSVNDGDILVLFPDEGRRWNVAFAEETAAKLNTAFFPHKRALVFTEHINFRVISKEDAKDIISPSLPTAD